MTVSFTITNKTFHSPWIITDGQDVYVGSQYDDIVVRNVLCGMDEKTPVSWDKDRHYQQGNHNPFLCCQKFTERRLTNLVSLTGYWVNKPYHSTVYRRNSSGQYAWASEVVPLWGWSTVTGTAAATDFPTKQQELDRQWPCPNGYHIPTCAEWSKLLILFAQARGLSSYIAYDTDGLAYLNAIPDTEITVFKNTFWIPASCYQTRSLAWGIPSKWKAFWCWTISFSTASIVNAYYVGFNTTNSSFRLVLQHAIPTYVMCFKNRFS
jgi:hypothetical protein